MYINTHTHVFTLRTVLNRESLRVMTQRLRDHRTPPLIVDAVFRVLDRLLDRPDLLDERELLARLLSELRQVSGFDRFLAERLQGLPVQVVLEGEGLMELKLDTLRQALDEVSTALSDPEEKAMRPFDIVETLRLAMGSTITQVADALLEEMGPDDGMVALMMDIRGDEEPERDRQNFLRQLRGTREAALQRPGRVIPFFAVHPGRPDHFQLMEEAIGEGAFAGIKLYPSLGYPVDSPELRRVYAFCVEADVPVLLHCSHGGFYRKREFVDYCDPSHWRELLDGELAELRVCFAHFGGWESLGRSGGLDEGTWGHTILTLMKERPHVFTDLAFHTDQMRDPEDEACYFRTLGSLLADDHLRSRILFGSDSWLLRMEMTEGVFWRYYRERMSPADFRAIASEAPRAFLGFPEAGSRGERGAIRANLQRHLDFLVRHREAVGAEPASWVLELTGESFQVNREPADWGRRRVPARCVWAAMHRYLTGAQRNGGYAGARDLRLKELRYFRPRDPNFAGQICLGLARDLAGFCADQGGEFAPGWELDAAIGRLQGVLRRGERRLVEVAGLLDRIYDFEEALV
jgi:predicted TIM-barrel fold metal-dependent hydrolase